MSSAKRHDSSNDVVDSTMSTEEARCDNETVGSSGLDTLDSGTNSDLNSLYYKIAYEKMRWYQENIIIVFI